MKVELIDVLGDDSRVVQAARVSFSKEAENYTDEQNEKLIKYLAKNNHWTPFGHPHITLRCSAPIPIRTQAFKSKVGFVENEESRRYISTKPELYVPEFFRSKPEGSIKQGSGEIHPRTDIHSLNYDIVTSLALNMYDIMIEDGVCPEQARFILPQGVLVNWIWTGSLMAYARFCNLRLDPHAQKEVQDLAGQVSKLIEPHFPISWSVLIDG